ncbi:Zn-ribbon domain-containing OB-fold protein [Ottowia thiooxydans]|uniref:OB-fold protein n=1 Tax=Ottowia thiooxydans TaxID=219182 RepID=A0ABV2Q6N1_9BURK
MSSTERRYPDPVVDDESRPFWQALEQGVFLLKRCRSCNRTHYYPRSICPYCGSGDTEWYSSAGQGCIYSYSIARRETVPYAIAYVTLDEGVTIMTNLVGVPFDEIRVGARVRLDFVRTEGGQRLAVFQPG